MYKNLNHELAPYKRNVSFADYTGILASSYDSAVYLISETIENYEKKLVQKICSNTYRKLNSKIS